MSRPAQSPDFYTPLQRRLHWLVLVLLVTQYALQVPMKNALAAIEADETLGFAQFLVTTLHTWGGISIAAIMLWRWQLRRRNVPLNAGRLSALHEQLAKIHHVSLYVVIVIMASTGVMHYYLGWQFAERWHELGKWILLVLVVLHVAGALWHARKDSMVLLRMMGKNSLR